MLNFRSPQISDGEWMRPLIEASGQIGCDSAFGTTYIWRLRYGYKICRFKDFIIKELAVDNGIPCYTYPIGAGDIKEAIDEIIKDAEEEDRRLLFVALAEDNKNELERLYPLKFEFTDVRDNADYIYSSVKLADLTGRKYHSKRNHVATFEKKYNWSYEKITPENFPDALYVCGRWCAENGCTKENPMTSEFCAIRETFANYEELGFTGALLRVDGKPVAMTVGEKINDDVFVVHFEKALPEYDGAYAAINRYFVKNELLSYKLINREEDMGIEGLRKAKLSYRPELLLKKYNGLIRL